MIANTTHRLDGMEPDNLLAFLALLGLLRSLEVADRNQPESTKLHPKLSWDVHEPPLRPRLHVVQPFSQQEIAETAAKGLQTLSEYHGAESLYRENLDFTHAESRKLSSDAAHAASSAARDYSDLLASLMTDAAVKEGKDYDMSPIDPTPFCLLFGQGHQHFLERFATILKPESLPERGERNDKRRVPLAKSIAEALFQPWRREDPSIFAFRWDPEEDVRYALMAGNPTDSAYKNGTQFGANCLAVAGLTAVSLAPEFRAGRVRPAVVGGAFTADGFSFAWPIWTHPLSLSAIRALLSHPDLRHPTALSHLGVDEILISRRISVGKFMNFTRAQTLTL